MRRFILLALVAHGVAAANPPATVVTIDGKEIPGTLDALIAAPGGPPSLVLTRLDETLTLQQASILELRLKPSAAAPLAGQLAVLTLNHGDSLRGALGTLTDTAVTLHTSFAGELTFRRDMIASLRLVNQTAVLFTGPKPDQWAFSPSTGAWALDGVGLRSKASGQAAATVAYPEKFRIAVDIEWANDPRRFPCFSVVFLADERDNSHTGYALNCQSQYVDLRKRDSGEDAEPIGFSESVIEFVDKLKLRLELLVDTPAGTTTLLVDGRTVDTWKDKAPITPAGASRLLFLSDHNSQELLASRISLSSWDGDLQAVDAEDPSTPLMASGTSQQLLLRNGDIIKADHLLVKDDHAEIRTAHGDIRIPASRVRAFASPKLPGNPPTPKKFLGDVRGWFPDGRHLTFRLDDLKDGKAIGFSQAFGTAVIDLNSFERIEMNLSNRALQARRPR